MVGLVDDDRAGAQDAEHRGDAGLDDRLLDRRERVALAVADVPREHRAARHDGPEDRGQTSLHRRIHAHIVRIGDGAGRPVGRPAPSVHAPFTDHAHLFASAAYSARMREAFHDQLDGIFADLSEICGQVEVAVREATKALMTGDIHTADQVISGDKAIDAARERVDDTVVRAAVAAAAGRRRPADDRLRAADGQRARADGRPLGPRRQDRPPARAPRRGARRAAPDDGADGRDRRGHGPPRAQHHRGPRRRRRHRARPRRRGDGPAAPPQLHRAALHRLDSTASRPRSTSPSSVATTSASPTTPCRWPTAWSSWSPASSRSATDVRAAGPAQRPWLATAAAAASAASGSR